MLMTVRIKLFFLLAVASFIAQCPLYAQDEDPAAGTMELTIQSAVALSLTNNALLRAAQRDSQAADFRLKGQKGYWEPAIVVSATYEDQRRENTVKEELSLFTPVLEERNMSYSLAVEGLFLTGARYKIGYTLEDAANNLTNLTFREMAPFESEYASFAGVSITQPILKNVGMRVTRSGIEDAELRRSISRQKLRLETMLTIARTEVAFWNAWYAQQLCDLRKQSLAIANELLEDNQERFKEGKMSEIEVAQARVGAGRRERLWLTARVSLKEAACDLMNAMGVQMNDTELSMKFDEVALENQDIELEKKVQMALSNHPDVLIAEAQIRLGDLRLLVARNQRLPELNLVANYGLNGLGTTERESWDKLNEADYPSWSASCVFRLPLGFDYQGRYVARAAEAEKEKALEGYRAARTDVVNALRTAIERATLLKQMTRALEEEVEIAEMSLESERVLLANGKSTSRRVLEMEEDLSKSRIEYLDVQAGWRKVLVQLDVSDGGMLTRRNLEIWD
jgi:outer membrane protein